MLGVASRAIPERSDLDEAVVVAAQEYGLRRTEQIGILGSDKEAEVKLKTQRLNEGAYLVTVVREPSFTPTLSASLYYHGKGDYILYCMQPAFGEAKSFYDEDGNVPCSWQQKIAKEVGDEVEAAIKKLNVPLVVEHHFGLDGCSYKLIIEHNRVSMNFCWWGGIPAGWEPIGEIYNLISSCIKHPKGCYWF